MAKGMTTKAVLVGLGIAAGTLFGAMAPAHADDLGATGIVGSYTAPVTEAKTVPNGATAFDGIYTVDAKTVGDGDPDLIVGNVGLSHDMATLGGSYTLDRIVDPTLAVGSYTVDAATAKGL